MPCKAVILCNKMRVPVLQSSSELPMSQVSVFHTLVTGPSPVSRTHPPFPTNILVVALQHYTSIVRRHGLDIFIKHHFVYGI